MISSIPFSPIFHLFLQLPKFKTSDRHSEAYWFCFQKYRGFLVQISSTLFKILQSKFSFLQEKLWIFTYQNSHDHLQPDISVFGIIHSVHYTYSQLYSLTNPQSKIEVIHRSQKTPTCFGIELPSSGFYKYEGVYSMSSIRLIKILK